MTKIKQEDSSFMTPFNHTMMTPPAMKRKGSLWTLLIVGAMVCQLQLQLCNGFSLVVSSSRSSVDDKKDKTCSPTTKNTNTDTDTDTQTIIDVSGSKNVRQGRRGLIQGKGLYGFPHGC